MTTLERLTAARQRLHDLAQGYERQAAARATIAMFARGQVAGIQTALRELDRIIAVLQEEHDSAAAQQLLAELDTDFLK